MNKPLVEKLADLDKLNPSTKQLWGKMSPQHMVEHLILTVKSSNGKLNVTFYGEPEKIPSLRRFLLSSRPFPKGFISPIIGEGLLPLRYGSLDEAKSVLKKEVADYYTFFESSPNAVFVNPTFGELNKSEWDVFHQKHFTHHFQQFGIDS